MSPEPQKIFNYATKMPELFLMIYGAIRMSACIMQNIYCIPAYVFLNIILWPLYSTYIKTYSKIENHLYYSLLYIVGWWSYGCNMIVHEHGDDIYELRKDPNVRLLLIANHQSTADVPMMFQAFSSKWQWNLLWIMDRTFKWTNFGLVSQFHGDYFIDPKNYVPDSILNHCRSKYSSNKDLIIIFPEGGFRYKRLQSSLSFGTKRNFPILYNVTYPRVNGFRELLHKDLNITHVVDLTICYDDPDNVPSIVDVVRGNRTSDVHFYYKIHPVKTTDNLQSEEWLYEQWQKKEALLANHYATIKRLKNKNKSETKKNNDNHNNILSHSKLNGDNSSVLNIPTTLRKRDVTPPVAEKNDDTIQNDGDIIDNHVNSNSNNNINGTSCLKFRSFQEFASLSFDLTQGRPITMSLLKVLLLHLGFMATTIFLYTITILIISFF